MKDSGQFVHDWIKERQAAHLAAFQETKRKTVSELVLDLETLAAECADRAGDNTCHDNAMHDLMQESLCLRIANMLSKGTV